MDKDDSTLCFGNDSEELEKTEAELQSIIDETKQNLQEMKEDALNSVCIFLNPWKKWAFIEFSYLTSFLVIAQESVVQNFDSVYQ